MNKFQATKNVDLPCICIFFLWLQMQTQTFGDFWTFPPQHQIHTYLKAFDQPPSACNVLPADLCRSWLLLMDQVSPSTSPPLRGLPWIPHPRSSGVSITPILFCFHTNFLFIHPFTSCSSSPALSKMKVPQEHKHGPVHCCISRI